MKIIFKKITDQEVAIIDEETGNRVGDIFSPAGTTHNVTNAIQICGCSEFYDAWGCSQYQVPVKDDVDEMICDSLENKKVALKQTKDIQIMFSPNNVTPKNRISGECWGCFNNPCTCDNPGNHKHLSPYNVKRADDLPLEELPGKETIRDYEEIYKK